MENNHILLLLFRRRQTHIKHIKMKMTQTRSFASMLEAKGKNQKTNIIL